MLGQKKVNPDPDEKSDEDTQVPPLPRELPPLRTFVVRSGGGINPETERWEVSERIVEAHGLAIDTERMISFIIFLYPNPNDRTQVAQANKLILNADMWDEVEELNPLFPTLEKH